MKPIYFYITVWIVFIGFLVMRCLGHNGTINNIVLGFGVLVLLDVFRKYHDEFIRRITRKGGKNGKGHN